MWCTLCGRKRGIVLQPKPDSFLMTPINHTADVAPTCVFRTSQEPPGSFIHLSNTRLEGFETENGAALSHVSLSTEGDPRGPAGENKDTNVSQLTGISSTDFLSAWGHSSFLSWVHRLILNIDLHTICIISSIHFWSTHSSYYNRLWCGILAVFAAAAKACAYRWRLVKQLLITS